MLGLSSLKDLQMHLCDRHLGSFGKEFKSVFDAWFVFSQRIGNAVSSTLRRNTEDSKTTHIKPMTEDNIIYLKLNTQGKMIHSDKEIHSDQEIIGGKIV